MIGWATKALIRWQSGELWIPGISLSLIEIGFGVLVGFGLVVGFWIIVVVCFELLLN